MKKRFFSIFITLILIFTFVIPTFGIESNNNYAVMRSYYDYNLNQNDPNQPHNTDDYHAYKSNVYSITFLTEIDQDAIAECGEFAWDVSEAGDSSVMAWMIKNEDATREATEAAGLSEVNNTTIRYDVCIGAKDGVAANFISSWLFYNFTVLETINGLENLHTEHVIDMYGMFFNCRNLTSLDLSSWDTSNVINMIGMFAGCTSFESLNLDNFNTAKVTNMKGMFFHCNSLTKLDLSSFNTSNVTNMRLMFKDCSSLIELDLSNFNINKVVDMKEMFANCEKLSKLNIKNFDMTNVKTYKNMFKTDKRDIILKINNTEQLNTNFEWYSPCPDIVEIIDNNIAKANKKGTVILVGENINTGEIMNIHIETVSLASLISSFIELVLYIIGLLLLLLVPFLPLFILILIIKKIKTKKKKKKLKESEQNINNVINN